MGSHVTTDMAYHKMQSQPIYRNRQLTRRVNRLQQAVILTAMLSLCGTLAAQDSGPPSTRVKQFTTKYCAACHEGNNPSGNLTLVNADAGVIEGDTETWEKIVKRLQTRQMPPPDAERPTEDEYESAINVITNSLDAVATNSPNPGRTDTFRRLTRTEYANAVRDLLGIRIDAKALLPKDQGSHGFDNITVGDLSPTLLNRYISAARKISQLAIGASIKSPLAQTIRLRPDLTQEQHVPGLPIGTRGGALIPYHFPVSGEYGVEVRLMRDRNEHLEGLKQSHKIEILLDRERKGMFTIKPPKSETEHQTADSHLKMRMTVSAGAHDLGVTFLKMPASLVETKRQPLDAHFNFHRHPRLSPAVYSVTITGPLDTATAAADEMAWQNPIIIAYPSSPEEAEAAAESTLKPLMRRAYRRPISAVDMEGPMNFFREAFDTHIGGQAEEQSQTKVNSSATESSDPESPDAKRFQNGIEAAIASILVNPNFLFRIQPDPEDAASGQPYRISDVDLASSLSFFLWSSLPDDELLERAERNELHRPEVLEEQVRRMLLDDRSAALVDNFANQWLYLRNLDSITPEARLFPDFDQNLRDAFQRETELLFDSVIRNDQSVLTLLKSDYTFLNERLAKHYGIPHIYGSRFRRVDLPADSKRGGLLRHGSILTVTSYATRTSPVIRGHWILKNIIGSPPPPPPDDVPALKDNTVDSNLSVRERLNQHRANPACASCHDIMDPIGFALENFDAVGRWRDMEAGNPVDSTGGLPDGRKFDGVAGLEDGLLSRPELFAGTLTEKLLTFALGRGIDHSDAPAIRKIVNDAAKNDFRFSSLVMGIVNSPPFKLRMAE